MTGFRGGKSTRVIPEHCFTETLQRVGVADTDMMGIVHHANYVTYFERGRLDYLRRRGVPYKTMVDRGYHMPVIELNVRYRKPAVFDDLLSIQTRLGALSRVTVRFNYVVTRPSSGVAPGAAPPVDVLLEGYVLLACVDARSRPRQLPEDMLGALFAPETSPGAPPDHSW